MLPPYIFAVASTSSRRSFHCRAGDVHWLPAFLCALTLFILNACAQQPYGASGYGQNGAEAPVYAPTHYYPPPGPPSDPWGPYILEAATRFSIPEQWIRAVMAQESNGEEQAVSPVGAMGLMQLIPSTYQALEAQYGLGDDPFNPEDNILAGAAYIRQMYDRYGSPGFLAAYNAGPETLDNYLAGQEQLPDETVNYLAAVTPNLGNAVPMSGPLANYQVASAASYSVPTVVSFATGCDVNAAYDPDHPCTAQMANNIAVSEQAANVETPAAVPPSAGGCDLNTAYDPASPCTAGASGTGACDLDVAYDPDSPCAPANSAATVPVPVVASAAPQAPQVPPEASSLLYEPASLPQAPVRRPVAPAGMPVTVPSSGPWAIQVGAFSSAGLARSVAMSAQAELPGMLGAAGIDTPATAPFGGLTLYRARIINLSQQTAMNACSQLNAKQMPCIVVRASAG